MTVRKPSNVCSLSDVRQGQMSQCQPNSNRDPLLQKCFQLMIYCSAGNFVTFFKESTYSKYM